ncbi:hypothetical protein OA57_11700 [Chelonobacter oris]|uniref:Uncharacterized protein n=1 Tax=Chelonobacter oris TaxID=505317 RepID=A0A0A3B747_9PAST|nr:hypothetical protein [Chelonobacter oris]KGQ69434.1 hypothetical protein OA57_11700 [Chelonobacter oris]
MKKLLFSGVFCLFIILSLYGIITGNIKKNYISQREGEKLIVLMKNKFGNNIYSIDSFKYLKIKIYINGRVDPEFLHDFEYIRKKENTFCKRGSTIFIVYLENNTLFKYDYNSGECQ